MSKLINNRRGHTSVYNDIINEPSMTLKAKGLYLYLISKPDNWTFSARLIATQNNDQKSSINSALHELENFGLLVRVHVQGGYDYEIFDTIKVHSSENRLNGKSVKQLPKIDSIEKRSNISNKEFKAKRKERDNNISFPPSPALDVAILENGHFLDRSCFALIDEFTLFVSNKAKNPFNYSVSVRLALQVPSNKNHNKTLLAYQEFCTKRPDLKVNGVLPVGVNIFDLIGRD
jgi:predicted transcriptional regulator